MRITTSMMLAAAATVLLAADAQAQRRFGGGGHALAARGAARTSVNARPHMAPPPRPAPAPRPGGNGGGRPPRPDRGDINVNRPINVDRHVDVHDNGGWWDDDHDGCCDHPVAAAAAIATTAAVTASAVTAAAIGTAVDVLPDYCTTTVVNGVSYEQCGSTWYQPQFYGSDATYVVVAPPR